MPKKKLKRSRSSYRSFEEAKKFVAQLGINSHLDWRRFAHSGTMPPDIPARPHITYKKEWKGYDNFLGIEETNTGWTLSNERLEKIAKRIQKDTSFLEPFPKIPKTEYSAKNRMMLKKKYRKGFTVDTVKKIANELQDAYTIKPKETPDEKFRRARKYYSAGRYQESKKITDELVRNITNFKRTGTNYTTSQLEYMSLHAHNLFEFDQMDESITYYSEVAKQDEEGTAWMHLGNAYLKKDRLDDAIQAHHASLKLDPTDAIGWFNLACSYARKMQTVKACNALLVAFGIYRNHDKLMLDIKSDTDFDKIRNEPEFKKFISKSWEDLF